MGLENSPLVIPVMLPDIFPVMLAIFARFGELGALGLAPREETTLLLLLFIIIRY